MKKIFSITTTLFLLLCLFSETVFSCSIVIVSLRKEFRNAKDVFLGEIISVEKSDSYQVTFKVLKSWKGRKAKELTITAFDYCLCPNRKFDFEKGKQFLVMTTLVGEDETRQLIFDTCQIYIYQVDKFPDEANKTMKRLDSFWFRTWAKIYPF